MGAEAALECPDENLLVSLIEGRLEDSAVRALESHIDACGACESLFGDLAAIITPAGAPDSLAAREIMIGRYQILGDLGAGAMGVVYAAFDATLQRKVALKLLRPDLLGSTHHASARARLIREARLLGGLSHPNVLTVYEAGAFGDQVFIAFELVEGSTLSVWQSQPRPVREVVETYLQAARGLAAAHLAGLVHRDVKPANLMLGRDGRVRVADFGLATAAGANSEESGRRPSSRADTALRTASGAVVGTPAYMAPEQFAGRRVDARSDQFSFCVALAEALTGERPMAGATIEDIDESMSASRLGPSRARVSRELLGIVARGLNPRAVDRWESMSVLASALENALALGDEALHESSRPSVRSSTSQSASDSAEASSDRAIDGADDVRNVRRSASGASADSADRNAASPRGAITTKPPVLSPTIAAPSRARWVGAGVAVVAVSALGLVWRSETRGRHVVDGEATAVSSLVLTSDSVFKPEASAVSSEPSAAPPRLPADPAHPRNALPFLPAPPRPALSASASASRALSQDEMDLTVAVERAHDEGNAKACLAAITKLTQEKPALASRADLVVDEAQCLQMGGDCEAGRKLIATRLTGTYSGADLQRAIDGSSIPTCRAHSAESPTDGPDFARKRDAIGALLSEATTARSSHDLAKCRAVASSLADLSTREKLASEPKLTPLMGSVTMTIAMCLADSGDAGSCKEARAHFASFYKTSYPELIAKGVDDAALTQMFHASFPRCP